MEISMETICDENPRERAPSCLKGWDVSSAPSGATAPQWRHSEGGMGGVDTQQCRKAGIMGDDVTIVVVDDEQYVRELVEDSLVHLSKNIASFADCWSAWMHIKSNRTDLVIADVHMYGMNGLDLLRNIKRVFPQTKCIMISADYSSRKPAMELGADAFLCKPLKNAALTEMVTAFCPAVNREYIGGKGVVDPFFK